MFHQFDIELAERYGLEEAILLNHLAFWVEKNRANGKGYHDGRYWTYNSVKAFNELFPYMTEGKIRRALSNLEDAGLLLTGNYNIKGYDRTKWYALTDEALSQVSGHLQKQQMDLPKTANASVENGKPIPDRVTDTRTDKPKAKDSALQPIIEGYTANVALRVALADFIAHRREVKAPMTERALRMTLKRLDQCAASDREKVRMLETSIANGWRGVFPPRGKEPAPSRYEVDYTDALEGVA